MLVPTTASTTHAFVTRSRGYSTTLQEAERILSSTLHLKRLPGNIEASVRARFYKNTTPTNKDGIMASAGLNELQKAFCDFLQTEATECVILTINEGDEKQAQLFKEKLFDTAPKRWGLYPPMIILSPGSINSDWKDLLESSSKADVDSLYQNVLKTFSGRCQFTHVALNKGIPLENDDAAENTIRAPSSEMARLYGGFGPDIPAQRFYLPPDSDNLIGDKDFEEAFWVHTKQNGLYQFWAPRWTMFSRGNVKEKKRVLGFGDAYSYTKKGKQDKRLAQIRSDMRDKEVIVLDSSSDGQPSLEEARTEAQIDPSLQGVTDNAGAMGSANKANVTSSHAESPKPSVVDDKTTSKTNMTPQDEEQLHLDGDTPAERKHPTPKKSKRKHDTFESPKLDKFGKPKIQEVQLALDLYAGIGYFTLSYLKLGYDVIAYELNPFSVEGLRRGAEANGYDCTVIRGEELIKLTSEEKKRTLAIVGGENRDDPIVVDDDDEEEKTSVDRGYGSQSKDDVGAADMETTLIEDAMGLDRPIPGAFLKEDTSNSVFTTITTTKKASIIGKSKAKTSLGTQPKSLPAKPQTTVTQQFLETSLQGQFFRPPHVIAYEQSNEHAYKNFIDLSTQHSLKGGNPYKIRHVNLGFLPSSSDSWDTAAQLIASNLEGGTVHVHENVHIDYLDKKQAEILETFDELINPYCYGLPGSRLNLAKKRMVTIVHREMVKSYAPSVWHVVFDVKVGPKKIVSGAEKRDRMNDASYYDGVEAAFSPDEAETAPPQGYGEMDVDMDGDITETDFDAQE